MIRTGKVKLGRRSNDGRENLLAVLGPGELLGELSLFDPGLRTATATALTDAVVLQMGHDELAKWLATTPSVAEHDSCGSAIRVDHRRGKVVRRLSGNDPEVNEEWISDKDRFAFGYATATDRLTHPQPVRRAVMEGDGEQHIQLQRAGRSHVSYFVEQIGRRQWATSGPRPRSQGLWTHRRRSGGRRTRASVSGR